MGWQVRALRVYNSPSPLHSLHSFDEVQQPVNGFIGWSEVSNSVFSFRYILFTENDAKRSVINICKSPTTM